jgi:hypothetical protein
MCTARAAPVPGRGVQQGLEFATVGVLGDLEAGDGGRPAEVLGVVGCRLGVDASEHGHAQLFKQCGQRLVGLHHEHLDDGVREGVVLGLGVDDLALLVEDQLDHRQVQVDHAAFRRRSRITRASSSIRRQVAMSSSVCGVSVLACFFASSRLPSIRAWASR